MSEKKEYDVFISYSRRDAAWVDDFCENLGRAEVKFYRDIQQVLTTGEIDETIKKKLHDSKYLLLILSPNAIASDWVRSELKKKGNESVLVAQIATAPTLGLDNKFDFEPKYDRLSGYGKQYVDEFRRLCIKLEKQPVEPYSERIHPPFGQLPGQVYSRLLALMKKVLAWPATKKGLCVMLKLPPNHLESEVNQELVANYLVHSIANKESLPNNRACLHILEQVKEGCALSEKDKNELDSLTAKIQGLVTHQVDDEFVRQVHEAIGDRYDITKILGGSFTIVLQARDFSLKRDVAIKVLRPRIVVAKHGVHQTATQPQPKSVQEPFQYYAQIAASIDHPGFLTVYGARFTEAVSLCVSEYFSSVPLAELVRLQRNLDVKLIVTMLRTIGNALIHLEKSGMVHTCLNPENIFIAATTADHRSPNARTLRLKISPFGIANQGYEITPIPQLYELAASPSRRTQLYCGPEQASKGYLAAAPAQQFGFGLLAVELLLGHTLSYELSSKEAKIRLPDHVETWIGDSTLLSDQDLRKELVLVVQRMLNADPEQRYASMEKALRALLTPLASAASIASPAESQALGSLAHLIDEINRNSSLKTNATALSRASFSDVLNDGFLKIFIQKLHSHKEVAEVFEKHWGKRSDRDTAEQMYVQKLRLALRAIIEYGAQPSYESLGLENVVANHGGYGVSPELYPVFLDTLMDTLEEWKPPFGVAAHHYEEVKQGWTMLTQHVLNYVQGNSNVNIASPTNSVADRAAAGRTTGGSQ